MWLTQLKTFDLNPNRKYTFLISFGSLEQHGPYAPLGTDTFIQDELLQKVEAAVPKIIVLPTIPITRSTEHLGFTGTISLQSETFYSIIKDIVNSLKEIAETIVFVSWHGGNKQTISRFIEEQQENYSVLKLIQLTFGDEGTDVLIEKLFAGPIDDHAGNSEVSIMLAVNPMITQEPSPKAKKEIVDYAWDKPLISVTPEGVIDTNPNWITNKEIGNKLIQIFANNMIRKIKKLT